MSASNTSDRPASAGIFETARTRARAMNAGIEPTMIPRIEMRRHAGPDAPPSEPAVAPEEPPSAGEYLTPQCRARPAT